MCLLFGPRSPIYDEQLTVVVSRFQQGVLDYAHGDRGKLRDPGKGSRSIVISLSSRLFKHEEYAGQCQC